MRHLERVGVAWYGLVLRLYPRWLRSRMGEAMLTTFADGQAEAGERGVTALLRYWLRELGGALAAGVRARLRGYGVFRPDAGARGSSGRSLDRRPRGWAGGHPGWSRRGRLWQDLRFAFRALRRRPAYAALAILTIGLGVGASAAMFSVVDGVLLRPLPYPHPDQLVMVYTTIPEWRGHASLGAFWDRGVFSYPEFVDWRTRQQSFQAAAALSHRTVTVTGGSVPERIQMELASPSLFPMLGIAPARGRLLTTADGTGVGGAVLLSYRYWQSRFGGRADVVGREIVLDDVSRTVVGVLPRESVTRLRGLDLDGADRVADVWSPITGPPHESQRGNHMYRVLARLRTGVTLAQAQDETGRLLLAISPPGHFQHGAQVLPYLGEVTRSVRAPLLILETASILLLLVACISTAALLLGAGADRERELAVRQALGAGRGRLAGQLLTESLVLACLGGGVGILLALAVQRVLVRLAPAGVPRIDTVQVDFRVVAFAALVSAASGVLFGLVPALRLSGASPAASLRGERVARGGRGGLQSGLVVLELALATVLLAGAGLLTRTMVTLNRVDPGFDPNGLLTVRVAPAYDRFPFAKDPEAAATALGRYFDDIVGPLRSLPGVTGVAITSNLPYSGDRSTNDIEPEGYVPAPGEVLEGERRFVSWNYLHVMRMPLLAGRLFTAADDRPDAAPVMVVASALARHFWPGESAVGKSLSFNDQRYAIVGVVADVRDRDLRGDAGLKYFVPRRLEGVYGYGVGSIVIRSTGDPAALIPAVRRRIWSVDPDLPISSIVSMDERIAGSLAEQRYRMRLMLAFAALAAIFALTGVYGVVSRSVARRTRELGIRMALGARQDRVLAAVLGQGLRLAAFGGLLGLLVSLAANRVLTRFLYGTRPSDPVTLVVVALFLLVTASAAVLGPARRATRVDPVRALREE